MPTDVCMGDPPTTKIYFYFNINNICENWYNYDFTFKKNGVVSSGPSHQLKQADAYKFFEFNCDDPDDVGTWTITIAAIHTDAASGNDLSKSFDVRIGNPEFFEDGDEIESVSVLANVDFLLNWVLPDIKEGVSVESVELDLGAAEAFMTFDEKDLEFTIRGKDLIDADVDGLYIIKITLTNSLGFKRVYL